MSILDPLLTDPEMQERWRAFRRAKGSPEEPPLPIIADEPQRDESAALAEKERRLKEELAANVMQRAWYAEPACETWRLTVVNLSHVLPPFGEEDRARLPSMRQDAKAALVLAVKNLMLGFTDERIDAEAELFCRNFELPVDGSGGSLPREHPGRGVPLPVPGCTSKESPLTAWAFVGRSTHEEQQREEIRQRNIARASGFGATSFRR